MRFEKVSIFGGETEAKKGQFFLLAAVIISAVIISFGVGSNHVSVNKDPDSFYDSSYEVKRETGAVLDYDVYTGFDSSANLTEFVDLMAKEIEEKSPGSNFIFIYGNGTDKADWNLRNYGTDSVYANGVEIEGLQGDEASFLCLETVCQSIDQYTVNFEDINPMNLIPGGSANNITIVIEGNQFNFPTSEYRQVIFIVQKNVGGDRHVVVE